MKEIRPYQPHELDAHPDKERINSTIRAAVYKVLKELGTNDRHLARDRDFREALDAHAE